MTGHIEDDARELFEDLDKDSNGYLSREELTQSTGTRARLVSEALLESYDWIKDQANDEWGQETQISKLDIVFMGAFRDDQDLCSKVINGFRTVDANNTGFLSWRESYEFQPDRSAANLFNGYMYPNLRYGSYRYDRMDWLAGLSNDSWGPEGNVVSVADLKVLKQGADLIKRMDRILSRNTAQ
jgi:hypothetical protein